MKEKHYICDKDYSKISQCYLDYAKVKGFHIKPQNTIEYDGVEVSKLTVVKPILIEKVLKRKNERKINSYLTFLVSDEEDDDNETTSLVIDDLERYKIMIMNKYSKFLDKNYIKALLKQVGLVEYQLKEKIALLSEEKTAKKGRGHR